MDTTRGVLDRYLDSLRAAAAPKGTIRLRRHQLGTLRHAHPDLLAVSTDDLAAWIAGHGWSAATIKTVHTTLHAFYRWACVGGLLEADPSAGLPVVRSPRGRPRPAPADVIERAVSRAQPRELVMLLLALLAGLRRAEIAGLHAHDVDVTAGLLVIRGKGGRVRTVPLHPELEQALLPRLASGGYVFPGREEGHLSAQYVGKLLAALLGRGWSGHTLRHAAASRWYAASRDILAVRDLLGHASVATTQVYTATPSESARAAVLGAPRVSAA